MKYFVLISAIITFLLIRPVSAQSSKFLIEPYFGILNSAQLENKSGCSLDCKTDLSGNIFGGRAGWTNQVLAIGVEAAQGTLSVKDLNSDFNYSRTGFFLKFFTAYKVDLWYTHHIDQNSYFSTDPELKLLFSSGYTAGVGYRVWDHLSLNLEMTSESYDKQKISGVETSFERSINSYVISVSFPFIL